MAAAGQPSTSAPTTGEAEAGFVSRVAAERRVQGRAPLTVVEELAAVGRRHSAAMASDNRVYHNPYLAEQVRNWEVVGENVGSGYSVDDVHNALMSSPRHRDVILNPRFTEIGVGVVVSNEKLWVTEVFRQPTADTSQAAAEPAAPAAEPTTPTSVELQAEPAPPPPAPAPAAPAARLVPAAQVRGTTVVSNATTRVAVRRAPTTTDAQAPIPPPAPPLAVPAPPGPEVPTESLALAVSNPLPEGTEIPAAGLVAALMLWAVTAGLTGVTIHLHPRGA